MNKVTLISLSYNHISFVKQALESFIRQKTTFDYEIIIADDGSIDGTANIIKKYAKQYPHLIKPILRKKNIGVLENYLDAYSKAKSEYIAYCECDDYFTDSYKLQKQVDFLEAHPECSICFHKTKMFYEDNSHKTVIAPTEDDRFGKTILTTDDLFKTNFIPSNSVMYRWRFNNENIYDVFPKDIMPADYYLHLLHAQKGKIGFIDETMTTYRKHKEGTWLDNETIYQKHGEKHINFCYHVYKEFTNSSEFFLKKYFFRELLHFSKKMLKTKQTNRLDSFFEQNPNITAITMSPTFSFFQDRLSRSIHKKKLLIIIAIFELVIIITLLFLIVCII